jgi:predicted NBD/HSP70 family sugar kinase
VHEAALVLGLDLGARFVRGSISDIAGDVRARQDVELPGADADATLAAITALGASLIEATGLSRKLVNGAVVGVPGVVDDGGRLYLTHFRSLEGRELRRELSERLGLPVTLENDINLAALGEQAHGVARGVDDFALLSVGTGLGIGLVLRGELHRGRRGAAGSSTMRCSAWARTSTLRRTGSSRWRPSWRAGTGRRSSRPSTRETYSRMQGAATTWRDEWSPRSPPGRRHRHER